MPLLWNAKQRHAFGSVVHDTDDSRYAVKYSSPTYFNVIRKECLYADKSRHNNVVKGVYMFMGKHCRRSVVMGYHKGVIRIIQYIIRLLMQFFVIGSVSEVNSR